MSKFSPKKNPEHPSCIQVHFKGSWRLLYFWVFKLCSHLEYSSITNLILIVILGSIVKNKTHIYTVSHFDTVSHPLILFCTGVNIKQGKQWFQRWNRCVRFKVVRLPSPIPWDLRHAEQLLFLCPFSNLTVYRRSFFWPTLYVPLYHVYSTASHLTIRSQIMLTGIILYS